MGLDTAAMGRVELADMQDAQAGREGARCGRLRRTRRGTAGESRVFVFSHSIGLMGSPSGAAPPMAGI